LNINAQLQSTSVYAIKDSSIGNAVQNSSASDMKTPNLHFSTHILYTQSWTTI